MGVGSIYHPCLNPWGSGVVPSLRMRNAALLLAHRNGAVAGSLA
jgi:hypothetical protein